MSDEGLKLTVTIPLSEIINRYGRASVEGHYSHLYESREFHPPSSGHLALQFECEDVMPVFFDSSGVKYVSAHPGTYGISNPRLVVE